MLLNETVTLQCTAGSLDCQTTACMEMSKYFLELFWTQWPLFATILARTLGRTMTREKMGYLSVQEVAMQFDMWMYDI